MAEFQFKCPQCGQAVTADESLRGQTAQCPFCEKGIVVPRKTNLEATTSSAPQKQSPNIHHSSTSNPHPSSDKRGNGANEKERAEDRLAWFYRKAMGFPVWVWMFTALAGIALLATIGISLSDKSFGENNFTFELQRVDFKTCPIIDGKSALANAIANSTEIADSIEIGRGYNHNESGFLQIIQVFSGKGVLVGLTHVPNKTFFVLTKRRYVDHVNLFPCIYVCVGTLRYLNKVNEFRTVYVFEEMPLELSRERLEKIAQRRVVKEIERQKQEETMRMERERLALQERERNAQIEREMKKVRMENERKLQQMKAEAAARENAARQEAAKKEEEDRQQRYPEEQRQRAEYAATKLLPLSFDLSKRFRFQNALAKCIKSAVVTDRDWNRLTEMQKKKDWLGMLGVIDGNHMKEYPELDTIDGLMEKLNDRKFYVDFRWKRPIGDVYVTSDPSKRPTSVTSKNTDTRVSSRRRRRFVENSDSRSYDVKPIGKYNHGGLGGYGGYEGVTVEFVFGSSDVPIVLGGLVKGGMSNHGIFNDIESDFKENVLAKLKDDKEKGRLSPSEYEVKVDQAYQQFAKIIDNWLRTSEIAFE